jgi:nucleoside-diphosphate-sugar epimerase
MKILLTGSEGFIGQYVRQRLLAEGCEVLGVDCVAGVVHGHNPKLHEDTVLRRVSELRRSHLDGVDMIIHLAAMVSVADSMVNPWTYVHYNTTDTLTLLLRLQQWDVQVDRFIVASSSSVYGNVDLPFREDGPTDPSNVYGLTKFDQEKLVLMHAELLGYLPVATRFFNVYGPGQSMINAMTGVMANFAKLLLRGEAPKLTEDGKQVRDFIYVEDVADAVVRLALTTHPIHSIFNVCTGHGTRLYDATARLATALGSDCQPEITGAYRPGDQRHVLGSNDRLRATLPGWTPRTVESGFEEYADALRRVRSVHGV